MKYQIIGKNVDVTEGISSAIQKKCSRLDKYFVVNDEVECRAVISTHVNVQKVEITVFLPQVTLRAEVRHEDLYAAIDLAIDKLEDQMRKLKTRMHRNHSRDSFAEALHLEMIEEEKEKSKEDVIVRAKSYYLTSMNIEEAITRMEALGHNFFMYLDEEDDRVSVVYIRDDGGYGVIQAENPIK